MNDIELYSFISTVCLLSKLQRKVDLTQSILAEQMIANLAEDDKAI